jgi:serpin B
MSNRASRRLRPGLITGAFIVVVIIIVGVIAMSAHSGQTGPGVYAPTVSLDAGDEQVAAFGSAGSRFAGDMYRIAREQAGEAGNIVIAPYSIQRALAFAYLATEGRTREQMRAGLRIPDGFSDDDIFAAAHELTERIRRPDGKGKRDRDFAFLSADAAWIDEATEIGADYLADLDKYGLRPGRAPLRTDGADSAKLINDWANQNTKGLIPSPARPVDFTPNSAFVLANAVYFEGWWESPFDTDNTRHDTFTRRDGTAVRVPFMVDEIDDAMVGAGDNYIAVALPYKSSDAAMLLILPTDGGAQGSGRPATAVQPSAWLAAFDAVQERIIAGGILDMLPDEGHRYGGPVVILPKFSLRARTTLDDAQAVASALGVDAERIDLPRAGADIWLDQLIHEARIDVDENRTVAAAVTMGEAASEDMPTWVRFDRPFFFALVDTADPAVLFVGRVMDPSVDG